MANKTPRKASKKTKVAKRKAKIAKGAAKSPRTSTSHTATRGLNGWITHTELASADPAATKAWGTRVFGWKFKPALPMPGGDYHLFSYSELGGGGVRQTETGEAPHTTPTVHVADCKAAFAKAIREGAEPISAPERAMEGVTIAQVRAPGGVLVGLSGP